MNGARAAPSARVILGFVAAAAAIKLAIALVTGFGDDEAYTLVIARRLALSYFDHPPLHQWILHGFVGLVGEGKWDRLPFWAMQTAINLPLFFLTRRLFGREAALWALVAFNASAYFLLLPDGSILPDTPLLLALTAAVWAVAELFYGPRAERHATALWLATGAAFGLAGLAKYSAVLAPLGLAGFLIGSPAQRRWLADWRPYAAAVLALAIVSPALIWNAEHGWVSLAFQSERAVGGASFGFKAWRAVGQALAGQIALLAPWIAVPMLAGLGLGLRRGDADNPWRLLVWLSVPPLILFAALPLVGQRAIPHWFNAGWIFAFPLAGAWLAERSARGLNIWFKASVALAALMAALYVPAVLFGVNRLLPAAFADVRDPTSFSYDWPSVAETASWKAGGAAPAFVLVENWRVGGRVGAALGLGTEICALGPDPRGFAFACDPQALMGRDALLVAPENASARLFAEAKPYFNSLAAPETFTVGRFGRVERVLQVARADRLVGRYPLPYGP